LLSQTSTKYSLRTKHGRTPDHEWSKIENGRGVRLYHYQLWCGCGRHAIEIGQCISSVAHRHVIVLIFDISHSRVGLIQISQQPLVDLHHQ